MKKQLIANLPYLLFVFLFAKVAQAIRLAPGADLSEQLLHLGKGFASAFSHVGGMVPRDLLIGAGSAALLRMAAYIKAQNAKRYRHGVEYGSARWGTVADIAPFMDKDFFYNIPLTKTERLTMSSRPKQAKFARNKNVVVIGGSGSGKTRSYVKPSLLQMHSSYVVTDPKGSL